MFCSSPSAVFETAWFEKAWREDRFETWFQPIVSTNGTGNSAGPQSVLGHECVVRLIDGRMYGAAEIFEAAGSHDEAAFEAHTRRLAIRAAASQRTASPHSEDGLYFLSFPASTIRNADSCIKTTLDALDGSGMSPGTIVFEVMESCLAGDPGYARRIRDFIGRSGFGFALNDAGTCADSLQMVCDLEPEYITLDSSLVHNVERPVCAATVRKLVELADRFGGAVIAKGVQRTRTMENLWLLGIEYMQGYLFGNPAPRALNPTHGRARVVSISGRPSCQISAG
jgi:EAL domain-containing protein (putative c-di-GMP-specific phosphodiesterase class I)